MSSLLLASSPIYGHVLPMTTIGVDLATSGHDVTVLTGSAYRGLVTRAGLRHRPLPAEVDYDGSDIDAFIDEPPARTSIGRARQAIVTLFVRSLGPQYAALAEAIEDAATGSRVDAVIADTAFLGMLPLVAQERIRRPAVFGISATPLSLRSIDCAHFGSALTPGRTAFHRHRNAQIDWLLGHGPLRPIQVALDAELGRFGMPAGALNYFDTVAAPDLTFHLGPRSMEYPRREMPDSVRFVGPLRYPSLPGTTKTPPPWWGDVAETDRPIVHVTQGTLDTADPAKLLLPAVRGLADLDVLVVAITGGRPVESLTRHFPAGLPANVRVAEFLPYEALLPHCDVVVTNGGYGGVLRSLSHGVPLVVAGAGEDKPEVAARVTWAGAGLNLRTGRPSPRRVRSAVRRVLSDPAYGHAAAGIAQDIEILGDPMAAIDAALCNDARDIAGHLAGPRPEAS